MSERQENRGSGASLDDPHRLAAMHSTLGVASQKMLISRVYGEQNKDWFDDGRVYHPNQVCEQKIRLPSGKIRKVFFDESALDDSLPIPEELWPIFERAAANMPVPDTRLVSRFPLIEVKASTAAEAGKVILTHLKKAEQQGWVRGRADLLADGWRNDYELTRGSEKTIMSFDMRPVLLADSTLTLVMFSSVDSFEAIDQMEQRMKSYPASASAVPFTATLKNAFSKDNLKHSALIGAVVGAIVLFSVHSVMVALIAALIAPIVMNLVAFIQVRDEIYEMSRKGPDKSDRREIGDAIVQPDAMLAVVVGPTARSRRAITEALWNYIAQRGLQDQKNRTVINADEKLLPIFNGKKAVTMFEMVQLVSRHLE